MALAHIAHAALGLPGVTEGTGFGTTPGLRVDGKIFAMELGGRVVLKLPAQRCTALVAAGVAERVQMRGRELREWVELLDPELDDVALAADALDYVRP